MMKTKAKDSKKRRRLLKGVRRTIFWRDNHQQQQSSELPEITIPTVISIPANSSSTNSLYSAISCTSEFPVVAKCRSIMTSTLPDLFEIPETDSESSVSNSSSFKMLLCPQFSIQNLCK